MNKYSTPHGSGLLNLRIAQLENQLKILGKQQVLCTPYPEYKIKLAQRELQIQAQLLELLQKRKLGTRPPFHH